MKRSNKKGFTIVELVIVIAIIAILAAVLIPTFASLIQKANESKDTQLVKNLNTALAADNKEHKTMTDALKAAEAFGYDVGKINASATGNEILWDSENDVFCYLKDGNVEYIPESNATKPADYKLWKIYNADDKLESQIYSIYWNRTDAFTAPLTVGFDAGKCTAITALKYERTGEAQTVVIRTSSGETNLTVDAANDTVMHYGAAKKVSVLAVDKTNSYHEFGSVYTLEATSGHIVLESGSLVYDLQKATDAAADLSFVSNGTVVKAAGIEGVTVSKTYDIYNLEQLCAFRDHVNAGMDFSNLPVEIKADIDMSSVSWLPIGTGEHPFNGTINGNNHTLKGLNNGTITSTDDSFTASVTKKYGAAYGFIAIAGSLNNEHGKLEISNLTLSEVSIKLSQYGNCVGALIGYAPSTADFADTTKFNNSNGKAVENINVKNVTVSGNVEGNATVGGVAGKLYNPGDVVFEDCTNAASVTADSKAGGVIGYISGKERLQTNGKYNTINITLKNLKNTGNVSAREDKVGGIVSYMNTFCVSNSDTTNNLPVTHIRVEKCVNTGAISGGKDCAGVGGILYSFQAYKTGYHKTSSETTVTVVDCQNSGALTNAKNSKEIVNVAPNTTEFGTNVTGE